MPSQEKPTIALVNQKVDFMAEDIKSIKEALENNYVTKDQFTPVRKIAYGTVSLLGLLVVGALTAIASLFGGKR